MLVVDEEGFSVVETSRGVEVTADKREESQSSEEEREASRMSESLR